MERRGKNIIYDKVRKERISLMIKRSIFCLVAIALIIYVVYSMTGTGGTTGNFDVGMSGALCVSLVLLITIFKSEAWAQKLVGAS